MFRVALILGVSMAFVMADVYPPPDLMEEVVKPIHELCTKKMGVSEAEHASYNLKTNTPDLKCYQRCLAQEAKWLNNAGEIDYDFILANMHPSIAAILEPAMQKCRNIEKGADTCDLVYNLNVCLNQVDPVHWFLP